MDVLNEHWVAAYHLADSGTEDDYDFQGFYSDARIYYQIADAVIYHIGEEELTSVTLTRDQILDIDAEEDYLNIKDRTTGAVTTYDASFTAVASVNSVSDFSGVSSRSVMIRSLQDSTEWSLSDYDFPDGYTRVYDNSGDSTQWGVVDMRGNLVVPVEYDDVLTNYNRSSTHFWANGYFAVSRDGMVGFVNGNGEVTCELKYPKDSFICWGMAGRLQNEDGTLTLVAADGTETPGFEHLSGYANGKFWRAEKDNEYILVDWHGNVVFEKCYSADVSEDEKFLIVQKDYDEPYELYAVDGATVEEAVGAGSAGEPAGQEDVGADEKTSAEAEAGTDAGAPAKPGPDDGAPADSGQETKGTAEQTETEQEKASEDGTANAGADAAQSDPAENGDGAQTDAQAGAKETSSAAEGILTAALQLVTTDMTANRDSILVLLQQAAALLETENPDAAAVLNSAVTLLQSGTEDANSVSTLIGTVQGML